MVPASAVETSSIISQKTDEIKDIHTGIIEDKNKLSETSNSINDHVNVIKGTINTMNHVKWYQFWKWDFYIRQGPNRILKESKIVESLSKDVNSTATNVAGNMDSAADIGNNSLQIGLEKANQITESDLMDNKYNVGKAQANANIIVGVVSSRFHKNYTVNEKGSLQTGDIVQYALPHNNYVYLEYVGMNPAGDTALLLGDSDSAVRLPISELNNIHYKILGASNGNTNSEKSSDSGSKTNNTTLIPNINSRNTVSTAVVHYIAAVQEDGFGAFKETNLADYNQQIDDKKDTRNTGTNLMIAGGVIGGVGVSMLTVILVITGVAGVKIMLSFLIPALLGSVALDLATVGVLTVISSALSVIGAALLGTGGVIYAVADSSIDDINGNKSTFLDSCNELENDFKTYNNGVTNNLPVAQDISIDTEQNSKITSILNAKDSDGDGLVYAAVKQPSNGVVNIKNNGTYTYTPKQGFTGNDSFTYVANDVYDNSNTATVYVTVHPVNHAPVSANISFDIETNNNLTAQLKSIDADGDPITYMLVNSTSNGNITVNSNGTFNYTPTDGFIGNETFTYAAKDWKENGNIATGQINVHPVNHLPVAGDVNLTVAKNENITGTFQATDADNDNLFFKIINKPSKGTITLNSGVTFTYIPMKNVVVNDSFTYNVYDWQGESNIATVNIRVYEFNHPPVANNIIIKTLINQPFTGNFNTTDLDDDKLTYKIVTKPVHGTLNLRSGQYIYTPTTKFKGNDGFTYQANDGKNQSNIATIKISILKSLPSTGNALIILNASNKVIQAKKTIESQIKNTPYTPNTNKQKNQPIPQTSNKTDINTSPEKSPTNYVQTLIETIKDSLNQIKQRIIGLLTKIEVSFQ